MVHTLPLFLSREEVQVPIEHLEGEVCSVAVKGEHLLGRERVASLE